MSGLEAIDRAPSVAAARTALEQEGRAWIVGGAIRDALLGESVSDADLAVERGREESAARAIARVAGGTAFQLSEEHATWRAIAPTDGWHLDVVALRAEAIEEDLRERDFTMNAIARPLAGGDLIDPLGESPTARHVCSAPSPIRSSATTRSVCCGLPGSRPGTSSRSTRGRRSSPGLRPRRPPTRPESASSRSCAGSSPGRGPSGGSS